MAKAKGTRCAVYTRKSSEEGLDQSFNSLHAQREACEAYILSQRHEGWSLIPTPYDDGGFSGGTMERPALKALLADIDAGTVDVVVVYKIDRLTRSLFDFSKIVEALDAHTVSFVSVSQARPGAASCLHCRADRGERASDASWLEGRTGGARCDRFAQCGLDVLAP